MLTQSDVQKISSIMQTALAHHPTKDDMRKYATKDDLKDAFKDYPTRDELVITLNKALNTALKGLVTKKEFQKESRSVQRKLNIIANVFDKEYLGLENRVQKIEYIIMK